MPKGSHMFFASQLPVSSGNTIIPEGDYLAVLRSSNAAVREAEDPSNGNPKYIGGVYFEIAANVGTGETFEEGHRRRQYWTAFLSCRPTEYGQRSLDRDGVIALSQAIGVELALDATKFEWFDGAGKPIMGAAPDPIGMSNQDTYALLPPEPVADWLRAQDGTEVQVRIVVKAGDPKRGRKERSAIKAFSKPAAR